MNQIKSIAVLMTCHNRRETTLRCLRALYEQNLPGGVNFETYLVDDGCTDDTGEAVREQFPDVRILRGDGNLYWCRGMRMAWTEAMKGDYDYYLWLNDDVILLPGAIQTLLASADEVRQREGHDGIIVGSCCDPETGERSYGGAIRKRSNAPVIPTDHLQSCDMMNGNIALIPCHVSKVVGNLSQEFAHTSGDNDYGLRAIKEGFMIWVAPGFQGLCSVNKTASWMDPNTPLCKRWRQLHAIKGQPLYETCIFARRHCGFFWILDILKLYTRVLFPGWHDRLKGMLKSLNRHIQ